LRAADQTNEDTRPLELNWLAVLAFVMGSTNPGAAGRSLTG